ncbi:conserved hypothetical protein [Microsporum canis CBS 113480]|uniref:DUF1688 domain-containing protein n=1 Tax=Arthroderma otae (strain ATCC MYA-4605 / CBS 113480) TaxID=554155 RepID=C5FHX6_ARTOC|nr:conserved hypothetical protein [Microsporum canis CBS 113480]EEQ28956.1 conserved hypothetical protein [Microsporum canis CBS 113480]
MGFFRRREVRAASNSHHHHLEQDGQESVFSNSSSRASSTSARLPVSGRSSNPSPTSHPIPEVPMAPPPDPNLDPAAYLKSIHAVRQRSSLVMAKAKTNQLNHFDVDMSKFSTTAQYIVSIIKRDYAPDFQSIPDHGRWQHFDVGGKPRISQLLQSWPSTIDNLERARRLIDLFLVSVLLDAGAGNSWSYKSKESGKVYKRSEGLAVASLEMFKAGMFSSDHTEPCQVDGAGLRRVTVGALAKRMQHSEDNPLAGLEGRAGLLSRLADALNNQELFGVDARPGNMLVIDYLLSHPSTLASSVPIIPVPVLWNALMDGLSPIWPPSRTQVDGISIGDAWPCKAMPASPPAAPWENIVPFHKLTQWLCYSIMAPMTKILNIRFSGRELLTGLPEYRNGGLLIDMGLLTLKQEDTDRGLEAYKANAMIKGQPNVEVVPLFSPDDDVIVEWRALTVGFLDQLLVEVNNLLELKEGQQLSLPQMLEAGSWKVSTTCLFPPSPPQIKH